LVIAIVGATFLVNTFAQPASEFISDKMGPDLEAKITSVIESIDIEDTVDGLKETIMSIGFSEEYAETLANEINVAVDGAGADLATVLTQTTSEILAKVLLFAVGAIVLYIVARLLFLLLNAIFKLPLLNFLNGILGLVMGGVNVFVVLSVIVFVLSLTSWADEYIKNTLILSYLSEINIIGKFITL